VGHSVVGFRSKSLKSRYKTAPGFTSNYISGSTESKECQALFQPLAENPVRDQEELIQELYLQRGQLNADINWLKKNLDLSYKEKLQLIDKTNSETSISHQADLLGISRSSICYEPVVDEYDLLLKRILDEQYTQMPFYGSRRMTALSKINVGTPENQKKFVDMGSQGQGCGLPGPPRNMAAQRVDIEWANSIFI
jgi:hypothetical protein